MEAVPAVAFPPVLGTPVVKTGAVCHARFQGHVIVGERGTTDRPGVRPFRPAADKHISTDGGLVCRGRHCCGRACRGDWDAGWARRRRGSCGRDSRRGDIGASRPAGKRGAGARQVAGLVEVIGEGIGTLASGHADSRVVAQATGNSEVGRVESVVTDTVALCHGNVCLVQSRDRVPIRGVAWREIRDAQAHWEIREIVADLFHSSIQLVVPSAIADGAYQGVDSEGARSLEKTALWFLQNNRVGHGVRKPIVVVSLAGPVLKVDGENEGRDARGSRNCRLDGEKLRARASVTKSCWQDAVSHTPKVSSNPEETPCRVAVTEQVLDDPQLFPPFRSRHVKTTL